ncbi:MAG: D-amino-acid transaminase [Rhodospirillaceae bacterium]|nr:D-amino-acid transaminase [Rhodospirillaceae bacterium]MYH37399.1 D-amino-acid transaminase [Rhodospirillaceae bacterium]MYK12993.1 D-amino-acid transaminase [Rhodospirillaceae bacterium]
MSRLAYVNGRFTRHRDAAVHIEDRGYQFADAVYEVIAIQNGRFVDEEPHLDRLERSLGELRMAPPVGRTALRHILRETVRRNRVRNGIVYMQVSRGVARRDHAFPAHRDSSLVVTARSTVPKSSARAGGVSVVTTEDIRWKRCDIKTVGLLPNVLAKQRAAEAGAYEAWMVTPDGDVTECTSANAWIVTAGREVVTRPPTHAILNGITRRTVRAIAEREGYTVVERVFSLDEAQSAAEAFLTSTTSHVMPVVRIDDMPVGEGRPGPLTSALQAHYDAHAGMAPQGGTEAAEPGSSEA